MLLEAINFAASYLTSPRRRTSEIKSSVNLWARSRRVARDWSPHEQNCHRQVLEMLEGLESRRAVAVLGSGLLRDTPIEALSKAFETVFLFDLQHIASVRLWAGIRGLSNLRFLNRDLSGVDDLRDKIDPLRPLNFLKQIADLDLVISANLLSQIGIAVDHMAAGDRQLPQDAALRLAQAHIAGLQALPCRALLLTDRAYEVIDRSGGVLERDDLMHGAILPSHRGEWRWTVAPYGELSPDYKAVHSVVSVAFNAA